MRIIADYHLGHWSAWFDDSTPESFGGPDAFAAMRPLLENSQARRLTLDDFEPDLEACHPNCVEMVLRKLGADDAVIVVELGNMSASPMWNCAGNVKGLEPAD